MMMPPAATDHATSTTASLCQYDLVQQLGYFGEVDHERQNYSAINCSALQTLIAQRR